jgi:hypothetical protein
MDMSQWPGTVKFLKYLEPVPADEDEDLTLGFSLLRELAASDETLVEVEPGVWRASKRAEEREL